MGTVAKSQQSRQSCKQDCPDFAERMKRKALRVRPEGLYVMCQPCLCHLFLLPLHLV